MKQKRSIVLITAFVTISFLSFAQKGIKGLVNAEKQFAFFTASHTVKEGFLNYMDSAGVIFRQGKDINALETYQKQKPGPGILSWEPAFAVVSASGDLGATTGPYEFRTKAGDTVIGRGGFSSIWRINSKGEWKNLADLGISYNGIYPVVQQVKEIALPKAKQPGLSYEEVLLLDKKLNTAIQEKNVGGWMQYISTDSWLNIDGQKPVTGMLQITEALQKAPGSLLLSSKNGEMSAAKDLAYIYGAVINGIKKENYLRVWIYRNNQWLAILQTIKW